MPCKPNPEPDPWDHAMEEEDNSTKLFSDCHHENSEGCGSAAEGNPQSRTLTLHRAAVSMF